MKRFLIAALVLAACGRGEVRTRVAEPAPALTLAGVVRNPQTVSLTAPASGPVIYSKRFAAGARVAAGETVAIIGNDQIAFAVSTTRLMLESAKTDYDRARSDFEQHQISEGAFTAAMMRHTLAKRSYDDAVRDASFLRVITPAAGTLIVTKRLATVSAGAVLAEVATNGAPILEIAITARERASLHPMQRIRFQGGTGRIAEVGSTRVIASIDGATTREPGTRVDVQVELDRER